jgi:ribose/xylose/arabinose/galactoside ABC-type transport system permease subunit
MENNPVTVRKLRSDQFAIMIPVVMTLIALLVLWIFAPIFFEPRNLINVLVQASTLGLMAIGLTFVLIIGGMDLSIPSVMALSAILGAVAMKSGASPLVGGIVMLITGMLLGAINGASVAYLRMIPFVVTLAMMQVATGASTWITKSVSIEIKKAFYSMVLTKIGIFPLPIFILLICLALTYLIARRSIFGRWLYALGVNEKAARVSYVPTTMVKFGAFVISGFFAGVTAIVLSARLGSAGAPMGASEVVLDVMSAAVVGGVSIYGGVGSPVGAVFGAIFMTILNNSLNLAQVEFFPSLIIKGVIIIAFVAVDGFRKR